MDGYNNTIAGGVRFWLLGESLGDGRETLWVGKTVRAGRGFGFSLVANGVTDMGELRTSEGSREVEDEKLGKSSTEVTLGIYRQFISLFSSPEASCWVPGQGRYRGSGSNQQLST